MLFVTGVKATKRACEVEAKLNNRKMKDELTLKLQLLLAEYRATAGLETSYGIFHRGIVKAMKESMVFSIAEIYEFENTYPPCHLLESELNKIITKLKW